jgi:hypothetical protein
MFSQVHDPDVPADVVRTMAGDYQGYNLKYAVARAQVFYNDSGSKTHATTSRTYHAQ